MRKDYETLADLLISNVRTTVQNASRAEFDKATVSAVTYINSLGFMLESMETRMIEETALIKAKQIAEGLKEAADNFHTATINAYFLSHLSALKKEDDELKTLFNGYEELLCNVRNLIASTLDIAEEIFGFEKVKYFIEKMSDLLVMRLG